MYLNSIFDAAHTYDTALSSAENTYSNSVFNAQKTATLAYYDAAIEEVTQSIDFESQQKASEIKQANELAQTRKNVLLNLFEDLSQISAADDIPIPDENACFYDSGIIWYFSVSNVRNRARNFFRFAKKFLHASRNSW